MHSTGVLGLAAFAALASATAIPQQHAHHHHLHQKRALDYVWVTETAEEIVTVPVTETVWLEPGETEPAVQSHYERPTFTSHIKWTVTAAGPSPESPTSTSTSTSSSSITSTSTSSSSISSSSSSEYVAPPAPTTPSSSSVYTPPPAPTTSSTTSEYVAPPAPTTTSTSDYVAPAAPTTPTTSAYVAPSSTWTEPAPASSSAAAPSPSSGSGNVSNTGLSSGVAASGTTYTGDLTWYAVGLGACGITSTPDQHIVAIAESIYDNPTYATANPNANPLCGKSVTITGVDGTDYTATVVDRCTGCKAADLDLSEDFFNLVTKNGDGRVHNISWKFD